MTFDFLEGDKAYKTTIYMDAPDAHWDDNQTAYGVLNMDIAGSSAHAIKLAPNDGFAINIIKA